MKINCFLRKEFSLPKVLSLATVSYIVIDISNILFISLFLALRFEGLGLLISEGKLKLSKDFLIFCLFAGIR